MKMKLGLMVLGSIGLGISLANAGQAVKAVVYSPHAAQASCHMNMGPTGAKAWMRGYDLVVMSIDQGSPAHGRLEPADVVTGAAGKTFGAEADPRITLGNAIGDAETTRKPLVLSVLRRGKAIKVEIPLPWMGAFSPSWPADCNKSKKILHAACESVLNAQMPNGDVPTDGGFGMFTAGWLLLATGEPRYLDGARRAAYHAAGLEYTMDLRNWAMSHSAILLAEYYLSTGDDLVLEKLQWLVNEIARGQMKCGSWGHSSPADGYGALNQVGLPCALALQLATECGVVVDRVALDKALDFFGRYAELGSVPYGDHRPGCMLDDNGKNSMAAILMRLAGRDREASLFSRSVVRSYWQREEGHTGGLFSMTWGPLAAVQADPGDYQKFMDYQRWYYNLCRTWRGELVMLPYHEALTRFDSNAYASFGGDFTTAGMALAFAQPRRHIRLLGAPASVFSPASKLSGDLQAARERYRARDWAACDKVLAKINPASLATDDERRWLAQLQAARARGKASIGQTLLEIDSNLTEGDSCRSAEQFAALQRCYGPAGDPRFAGVETQLASGPAAGRLHASRQYYEYWGNWYAFAIRDWEPQGREAKRRHAGIPSLRPRVWEPLAPTSGVTTQSWRTLAFRESGKLPDGWMKPGFDDREWTVSEGILAGPVVARRRFTVEDTAGATLRIRLQTVRPAHTQVYLNGALVVDAVRGQRGGYANIELDPSAFQVLRQGENVLALVCDKKGGESNKIDAGVDINRVPIEQRMLPPILAEHLYVTDRPAGDESLKVRDTQAAYQKQWQESYDRKDIPALLKDLAEPLPVLRRMAVQALVNKGEPGIRAALDMPAPADWRVRSAICDIVILGGKAVSNAPIAALAGWLADDHFWVRVRALDALASVGAGAAGALPDIVKLVQDGNEWVRGSAIRAVKAVGKDPLIVAKAAE